MAERAARSSRTGMGWTYETKDMGEGVITGIYDGDGRMVAVHVEEGIAAYIVKAVNCHDELVKALQEWLKDAEEYERTNGRGADATRRIRGRYEKARAAIARATTG